MLGARSLWRENIFTVVPNIGVSSICNLFRITLLGPEFGRDSQIF